MRFFGSLKLIFVVGLVLCAGTYRSVAAVTESTPNTVVSQLHETLIHVMENAGNLGYTGRYEQLEPVVEGSFDFNSIASIVLGRRYWSGLDETQRVEFLEVFRSLSTATYAARFDGYSGERFQFLDEKPLNKGRVLLKTELVKEDGESIPFNYVLQNIQSKWLIVSVEANGVNDLSIKRAEYKPVVKAEGLPVLLSKLHDKITEYRHTHENK